ERQLKPEPRKDVIDMFKELGVQPTSMIDVSDGLSSGSIHICTQSEVGCTIYENKLPIDSLTVSTDEEMNLNPSVCALNGGEDYELLFTIPLEDYNKIKYKKRVTIIGQYTAYKGKHEFVSNGDTVHELTDQGWNAMLNKED